MRVLFVSANSADAYLDIEREQRTLLQLAEDGNHYLKLLPAAQISDLTDALTGEGHEQFDVLHFAGHGEEEQGLVLRKDGDDDEVEMLDGTELANLLQQAKQKGRGLKLVVLNACNTQPIVDEVTKAKDLVDEIIGTKWRIADRSAKRFSHDFYSKLNEQATVRDAFKGATSRSGPYVRYVQEANSEKSITLPAGDPAKSRVDGLGDFYARYYGHYIDEQIGKLQSDRRTQRFLFWSLMAVGIGCWIWLFQNPAPPPDETAQAAAQLTAEQAPQAAAGDGQTAPAASAFWPNVKRALATALLGEGLSGSTFSLDKLLARIKALENFVPLVIPFLQTWILPYTEAKVAGLKRVKESLEKWDDLPDEERTIISGQLHESLQESLRA